MDVRLSFALRFGDLKGFMTCDESEDNIDAIAAARTSAGWVSDHQFTRPTVKVRIPGALSRPNEGTRVPARRDGDQVSRRLRRGSTSRGPDFWVATRCAATSSTPTTSRGIGPRSRDVVPGGCRGHLGYVTASTVEVGQRGFTHGSRTEHGNRHRGDRGDGKEGRLRVGWMASRSAAHRLPRSVRGRACRPGG